MVLKTLKSGLVIAGFINEVNNELADVIICL